MTNEQILKDSLLFSDAYADGAFKEAIDAWIKGAKYHRDHQWVNPKYYLPENADGKLEGYSVEVLGLFKDGSYCRCSCSIEERIWFIDMLVCDEPVLWTYLPNQ